MGQTLLRNQRENNQYHNYKITMEFQKIPLIQTEESTSTKTSAALGKTRGQTDEIEAAAKKENPSTPLGKTRNKSHQNSFNLVKEEMSPFVGEKRSSLMDISEATALMLISHYNIQDENILRTTYMMTTDPENYQRKTSFTKKFMVVKSSLKDLVPYQMLFSEKNSRKLFSKDNIKALFQDLEKMDMTSNVALQSLILVSAISLTKKKPEGMKMKVPTGPIKRLSKTNVKKRLSYHLTISQVLFYKSKDFEKVVVKKISKMHKDLLKIVTSTNKKQIISDRNKSSLSDLVNFNIHLAYSVYKITDKDSLESTLHSFQAKEDIEKLGLSPAVAKACKEVAMFRDLLLLGDLPTISQEKRPFEWIYLAPSLTYPAQVALMTSFLTLSIKLTGNKPSKLHMKVPGGRIAGKNKEDVVSYLAILQTIAESMSRRNNWEKKEKFSNLHIMNRDLGKIIGDF